MLVLMIGPYLAIRALSAIKRRELDARGGAATGLGILFIFTGIGHFTQTEAMVRMLPPWAPIPVLLVEVTGILEFAVAAGFLLPGRRPYAGWVAAIMLVLFFPANVYAAIHHIEFGGHAWGPAYLLIRAPLQAAILFWVYWFTIRRPAQGGPV
jgi:uncharacterized membrane protein